jgi:alpha-L-rhamnosidase
MSDIAVDALQCEYQVNPLGIDVARPRLSWRLRSDRRGARQMAYQVQVASSPDVVRSGRANVWDSGKVESDQSIHVVYDGAPLTSRQRVWWNVRVWDETGATAQADEPGWWEMGLLERSAWQGAWIGAALAGGAYTSAPPPFLRTLFTLSRPIASARLYATALGLYEISINGRRVGDSVFAPGWTDYRKRVQYQTYDVTDLLAAGDNVIGAILGDGWYCGHVAWAGRQHYGDRPKLFATLLITFTDGRTYTVATDATWQTTYGPLLESDLLMGESYDARREMPGWDTPAFDAVRWQSVEIFDDPGAQLVAQPGPGVRRIEEQQPISEPRNTADGSRWIVDLGQNMVGRVRLRVNGPAGATVTLRHAEALTPEGAIYTENLRTAKQTDHYTLRGGGEEIYEPRFTFHGFRYVELSGYPGVPTRDTITGIVLHSDMPISGAFECSDPLINQLRRNIVWGQKGNFVDVPTDCPQRDERLGWTGDAQVFVRTAAFNMRIADFFTKWLRDLADAQDTSGAFPPFAPLLNISPRDGGPAWADAGIICPWAIYRCYGDRRILEEHYDAMARFLLYLEQTSRHFIRTYDDYNGFHGFGDWLSINAETPKDLIGTAFFAHSAHLMSEIAATLNREADAARYQQLFDAVRTAFLDRFVTPDGLIVSQTQTAYVLALGFDLLPRRLRERAAFELVRDIERRGLRLSTGFVGAPHLPHVLSAVGRTDVAYALLLQKEWPSWLYPVTQGATTIWERWDGWTHDKGFQDAGMNSFNHYAYGSIGEWLYTTVAGIDIAEPGYKRIALRPRPGGHLTYARAAYESAYGRIESDWHLDDGVFNWRVVVPPNTQATVYVPAAEGATILEGDIPAHETPGVTLLQREAEVAIYDIGAGSYRFVVQTTRIEN